MLRDGLFVAFSPIAFSAVLLAAIAAAEAAFPSVPNLAAVTFASALALPLLASVIA